MPFHDREEAARLLAKRLEGYRGQRPLILGIPRGAVPMAKVIAEALDGELDVVLVHKLGAPGQPELAIGSVDEAGHIPPDLVVEPRYLYPPLDMVQSSPHPGSSAATTICP